MKVLVIGATGLLGKPVIEQLNKSGHQLRLFSRTIKKSALANRYEIVSGDALNHSDISKAINGCDAVHITLSRLNEARAVEVIINEAKKHDIKLISYVSGASVCQENSWFTMVENKLKAEKIIMDSGIPYYIYKPTWFYESLELMIRNNKASVVGKNLPEYHWISANDFGRFVALCYDSRVRNQCLYILGSEKHSLKELLSKYCKQVHPEIKKVSVISTGLLKIIGKLSGKTELKAVAELFAYFEKVNEPVINGNNNDEFRVLPSGFDEWLRTQKQPAYAKS